MREALLLDLGALVYELHRHGRREPELLQAKAAELSAVDGEVRALAEALDAGEGELALVAAGIAGSCESCGALLSTDARYCGACGAPAVPALERSPTAAGPALSEPGGDDTVVAPGGFDADPVGGLGGEKLPREPAAQWHGYESEDEGPLEPEDDEERFDDEPPAPWLADGDAEQRP